MRPAGILAALAIIVFGGALLPDGGGTLSAADKNAVEDVARAFIAALVRDNRPALRRLVPQRPEHRWGRFPFTSDPRLEKVVADKSKGGAFFAGGHRHSWLPQKSLFALVLIREDKEWPWKIRSVLWYERVPSRVRLPQRSPTNQDRANEKEALRCVRAYIEAWRKSDFELLERLTYHWVEGSGQKRPIRLRDLALKVTGADGEASVEFKARLWVLRIVPYSVDGTLQAVKEGPNWKVRENSIVF
jgi:hypothetical protein